MTSGLTIVIVTHNSETPLRRCLENIGDANRRRILVVDNASRDGTVALLGDAGVSVIEQTRNEGFGRAANLGAREAHGDYICFLNPDCETTPDLFGAGIEAVAGTARRCAAPILLEAGSRIVEGRQPGYTTTKLLEDILCTNYGDNALCRRLRARPDYHDRSWWWPHGACLFIPRRSFLDLRGFDERFYLYMEDVDLGRRLAAVGGEVVSLPVRVRHGGTQGARISRRKRLRLLNAARIRYAGLHHGPHWATVLALIAAPSSAAHGVRDWLAGP